MTLRQILCSMDKGQQELDDATHNTVGFLSQPYTLYNYIL